MAYRAYGDSAELAELAKSVDLTIMGQRPPNSRIDSAPRFRPDDVVMAAGRPVLVVPYAGSFETVGKRILASWDGSREANRALNDALLLLSDAQVVTVMYVGANERDLEQHLPALERITHHVQRHGVNAVPEETTRGGLAHTKRPVSWAGSRRIPLACFEQKKELPPQRILKCGYIYLKWTRPSQIGPRRENGRLDGRHAKPLPGSCVNRYSPIFVAA